MPARRRQRVRTARSPMVLRPITLRSAKEFVAKHHRHNKPPVGHKFSIAAWKNGKLVGVAVVGRPVARRLDDSVTAEVLRVATDGTKNAGSFLYARAKRAAQALGYTRVLTYTLDSESGATMRAVGATRDAELKTRKGWDCPARNRETLKTDGQAKVRWVL